MEEDNTIHALITQMTLILTLNHSHKSVLLFEFYGHTKDLPGIGCALLNVTLISLV